MPIPDLNAGLTGYLGMEYLEVGPDRVVLRWKVRPELHQPLGLLHGGVYCTAIESAASVAGALWYGRRGHVVGVSNQTDFLRSVRDGTLTAVASPLHRGRLQQLWQVEVRDESERLVARGQVRLQNLPHREPESGAEPGAERGREPRAEQGAEQGTEPRAEQGSEPQAEQGAEQGTEPGAEHAAEPEGGTPGQ